MNESRPNKGLHFTAMLCVTELNQSESRLPLDAWHNSRQKAWRRWTYALKVQVVIVLMVAVCGCGYLRDRLAASLRELGAILRHALRHRLYPTI